MNYRYDFRIFFININAFAFYLRRVTFHADAAKIETVLQLKSCLIYFSQIYEGFCHCPKQGYMYNKESIRWKRHTAQQWACCCWVCKQDSLYYYADDLIQRCSLEKFPRINIQWIHLKKILHITLYVNRSSCFNDY